MEYERKPISFGKPRVDDAILKGPSWRVYERDQGYLFTYISGELTGAEKSVTITGDDVAALRSGDLDQDAICIKYGVS